MGRVLFAYATLREVAPFAARLVPAVEIGVGKAAAAATLARELATHTGTRLVVLLGIAGAYSRRVPIGSLHVVAESVFGDEGVLSEDGFTSTRDLGLVASDVIAHEAELARRAVEALDADVVRCATVSTCSGTDHAAQAMAERTGAMVETMESAAAALACRAAGVDLLEVRAVSNYCGDRALGAWDVDRAVESLGVGVERLLASGLVDG